MKNKNILIPADVPKNMYETFENNYNTITKKTNRLMLFTCDQKIEHLNADFYGKNIHSDAIHPEHIFRIAQQGKIGALAAHIGLINRYAEHYPEIPYIAKLTGSTNIIPIETFDPINKQLWNVAEVITLKKTKNISICGIGLTLYIGSIHESEMLKQTAQTIYQAHEHGLITIVWIYPRGKTIKDDKNINLIAGAAGVGHSLGADFVKIKPPRSTDLLTSTHLLKIATAAAGNTHIICSGGSLKKPNVFLHELYNQIHTGGTHGSATGRNIFQRSLTEAITMTQAISAIVYENQTAEKTILEYF